MIEIIIAVASVLAAVASAIAWYYKSAAGRDSEGVAHAILQVQKNRRLCIRRAEERRKTWNDIARRAHDGVLSRDDVNRLLSGQAPNNSGGSDSGDGNTGPS